ncbi:S8 family serine peptidase [Rhodococcus sp. TAF43]|uniref:S8 family peptidase n=1 Tax=unclassified Rhodococcus (in: high G+C Gram-positive bacteria) TaxID=192944 RepID=UPI000E0C6C8C|nr:MULTISPECIES: S8 family serine peptidase [unclassified Rhodococcus (in: high G+C Gram-positive bacteria)]QKT11506.1 S8 family serine peptidase [Rhodococcus sp. W8901]RDI19927.1 serine protease AprX [Rhodococcus sp. AG1013]
MSKSNGSGQPGSDRSGASTASAVGTFEMLHAESVVPVESPLQKEGPFLPELTEVDLLVRAPEARRDFNVSGSGVTVAVLDTGLRSTHVDFAGRVVPGRNFTSDYGGDPAEITDGNGHGTSVAGIACAGRIHTGIAPNARVVPVKVLANDGTGRFADIRDALDWVLDRRASLGISALCLATGASDNRTTDTDMPGDAIGALLQELTDEGVCCCVAAGNDYYAHGGMQGMCYPAVFRQTISVGAVYDADEGSFRYRDGAKAFASDSDRLTPFTQRLHRTVGGPCATDTFAPGSPITSSGILNDTGESIQYGASQATPVVLGVVALLQSFYLRTMGHLPTVVDVKRWLARGSTVVYDGADDHDNVNHTELTFPRTSALGSLLVCAKDLAVRELATADRASMRMGAMRH